MHEFSSDDSDSRNFWWSEMVASINAATDVFNALAAALQPLMQPIIESCDAFMRAAPPEMRLNVIEQEYAFREFAANYNARHPGRRISWRRLNWRQRASAALNFVPTDTPG